MKENEAVSADVRKKANRHFFGKIAVNLILMIIGAVFIALFLRDIQRNVSLAKQDENSLQALNEAVSIIEDNLSDADELTGVFHDGNQDMLDDLFELFRSGVFDKLTEADSKTRADTFADIVERSGVDYLLVMDKKGRVLISPNEELNNLNLVEYGLLTQENLGKLIRGTHDSGGVITPAEEENEYGHYYFYSMPYKYEGTTYYMILGAEASNLSVQIDSLKDMSSVLGRASVGNGGFMFAFNAENGVLDYFRHGDLDLTGRNIDETGLSRAAVNNGYKGIETINGVRYYCVTKTFRNKAVICAVAETDLIYATDRYVLFWSVTGFILVMLLCIIYAVIVRNDFVRHKVETSTRTFALKNGNSVIFDRSIFRKIFPLMIIGVLVIYGISFYTQTMLEISQGVENSVIALDEVSARYEESNINRETIQNYYNNRSLSKARLIAYLIEEDARVLNEKTDKQYSVYDDDGNRHFLRDSHGNILRSVSASARLKELCDANDIESIYIFDENGHTIATSTANWFFTLNHDPESQSYPFLEVLDSRKESFVQEPMTDEFGESSQYIGVGFNYYTRDGDNGRTVYMSRSDYLDANGDDAAIEAHDGMLQIGLSEELTARMLESTGIEYVFSSDTLRGGYIAVFDDSEDHICLYSPFESRMGKKASDLGITDKAFSGEDYYGFTRVNDVSYFQYYRYADGYYAASAIPKESMYQARGIVALITALTSLLLIIILSGTVTLTTAEEERLYETMSEAQEAMGMDSPIFNIILPSGHSAATTKAAARWDNRRISWGERSPEQKLVVLISGAFSVLILYVILTVIGSRTIFSEESIIRYVLGGNWERGPNIFAFSACVLVMIFVIMCVFLLRIPIRLMTSILGARSETIGHLVLSIMKYGGAIGAFFYCLYLVGIDSTSILASAGVLSLVIGLGAQSLIKDILAGIFIVFEGEFRVGDIVTIAGFRGTVMDIGLRTTKILGVDGNIKIYNNSEITGVLNMTKEASVALCQISIEYGQDIDYVEETLLRELPSIRENNPDIIGGPDYLGVYALKESGVELLITCDCQEANIRAVTRYLNREVLKIFYRNGITVPFPNITISELDRTGSREGEDEARKRIAKKNDSIFE